MGNKQFWMMIKNNKNISWEWKWDYRNEKYKIWFWILIPSYIYCGNKRASNQFNTNL